MFNNYLLVQIIQNPEKNPNFFLFLFTGRGNVTTSCVSNRELRLRTRWHVLP